MAKKQSQGERLWAICTRLAEEMGFELFDAGFEKEPSGTYLRAYIDREGGISLDDCERFHRALQPLAEDMDYDFMEVSSPGIDRPLKRESDILRNIGSRVEVKLYKAQNGRKTFEGTLLQMDRTAVRIRTEDGEMSFPAPAAAQVRLVPDLSGLDEDSGIDIDDVIDDE